MGSLITKLVFPAPPSSYDTTLSYLEFVERQDMSMSFVTTYSIPVRYYVKDQNLKTLLCCHGNAEDINQDIEIIAENFNVNVCMFDFAGYGLHTCKVPSEYECQQDVLTVYNYLIHKKHVYPHNIVLYGRSLGSGIACYLANYLNNKHIKLILVSPLLSVNNIVTSYVLPGDLFTNYIIAPALILHGDHDKVVPYEHGKKLATLFTNLYKFVTLLRCSHNDIGNSQLYYDNIYKFIHS
jgi:pimeloyl-ACP methyl ester carboxylesterase